MAELSIKVSIANRIYPLKINREEEEGVRKAAKRINDILKEFEENYSVRDKQDLLAMVALQFASESAKKENKSAPGIDEAISLKLDEIEGMLNEFLASETNPA